MDRKSVLFFLACLIGSITCRPLQHSRPDMNEFERTDVKDPLNMFCMILQANKGIKVPVEEGDILIQTGRSAINCKKCLWHKSVDGTVPVPYIFSSNYSDSELNLFTTSMQEFESLTCVRFTPRTTEKDHISIASSQGCNSFIGRVGGAQVVGLDRYGCMSRGIIQHELDHALGIYHEHTRSDRDDYVNIMFQYISSDNVANFNIKSTNNMGLPYDYGSVMHYDKSAYSNTSNKPTIVPRPDPTVRIGQRKGLSILDAAKINRLYQCNVCATLLNEVNGTLNSANYPSNYTSNTSCVWLIRTPSGQATLKFNNFDVQPSPNCSSDYIKIYDGPSKTCPVLLNKTCGTGPIPFIVASTRIMLVEFVSDSSVTGVGFKATYGSVQCGGNFFEFQKNFTSPGYPAAYPPNLYCTFNITAPEGYRISLTISDFLMDYSSNCQYDYMTVQDNSDLHGPFCGDYYISPIISTGNSLVVTLHSDQRYQMRGFQASYIFIDSNTLKCGGNFTAFQQNFTSPGYPAVYLPNMECIYNITAPKGYQISLTINDFHLENSNFCSFDFLAVEDDYGQQYGRFCGDSIIPPIISTMNTLLLTFYSDDTKGLKGFEASYTFIKEMNIDEEYENIETLRI